MDIDEYPTNRFQSERNWLVHTVEDLALQHASRFRKGVGTIHARNMGFIGWPTNAPLLIDRLRNCTRDPVNDLSKPINLVAGTQSLEMHFPSRKLGYGELGTYKSEGLPNLYMAHFWGARLQKGPELPADLVAKVERNDDLEPMSRNLATCVSLCSRDIFHWVTEPYWDVDNRKSNAPPRRK